MADPTPVTVPALDPAQDEFNFWERTIESPYSVDWHSTWTITNIPQDSVGWLVAQGWQITGITENTSTVPYTYTYAMRRDSLDHWAALKKMMSSYISAYNIAGELNSIRYNQVVSNWTELIKKNREHFDDQMTDQLAHIEILLSNLDEYMDNVEEIANGTRFEDALNAITGTPLTGVVGAVEDDWNEHNPAAGGFLDEISDVEEERISAEFEASFGRQAEHLIDNGLWSSLETADLMERNTRDKDDQIQLMKDRLSRQKWENAHRTYEQRVAMRQLKIAGESQIADHKHKVIVELMNAAQTRLQWRENNHQDSMKLMAYQLDEYNKLFIGLYGFVERREDIGPSWDQFAKMCTSLSDSGGGWISP